MLANDIAVADSKIAALASEVLVERIGAEHGSGRDLVALAQRGPALHINIWLQPALRTDHNIFFDNHILPDHRLWSDLRTRVHARSRRHDSGRIDGHKFV